MLGCCISCPMGSSLYRGNPSEPSSCHAARHFASGHYMESGLLWSAVTMPQAGRFITSGRVRPPGPSPQAGELEPTPNFHSKGVAGKMQGYLVCGNGNSRFGQSEWFYDCAC